MAYILEDGHLDAWRALLNAHAEVIDRIERDLARERRIPLRYYDVLTSLAKAPGGRLRLSELADAVVLSRSGLSRLVERLQRAGLIIREVDQTDRRGAYAILAAKGKQALRQAWPIYGKGIQQYFARHLTAREASVLNRLLRRVAKA